MIRKRAVRIVAVVETILDEDAIRNLLGALVQDLTKSCTGRCTVAALEVPEVEARQLWAALNLGEKPAPDAKLWAPKRPRGDA